MFDLETIVCGTCTVENLNVKLDRSLLSTEAKVEPLENLVHSVRRHQSRTTFSNNGSFLKKIDSGFGALARCKIFSATLNCVWGGRVHK